MSETVKNRLIRFCACCAVILPMMAMATSDLPAAVKLDQYLLASKKFLSENDIAGSLKQLEKARSLETSLPAEFHYLYGKALKVSGQNDAALSELHQYLSMIERNGPHYEEVLLELVDLQKDDSSPTKMLKNEGSDTEIPENQQPSLPPIKSTEAKKYGAALSKMYLIKDTKRALIVHINDVLKSYAVQRYPIEKGPSGHYKPGVRAYNTSIDISKGTIHSKTVISDRWKDSNSVTRMERNQLDVYGIGPNIDYSCFSGLCELVSPSNGKALAYFTADPYAIEELQIAFKHLVKILQKED